MADSVNVHGNGGIRLFQIVVSLLFLATTAISVMLWARLDQFERRIDRIDVTQQARGERVRSLEQRMESAEARGLENRAADEWLRQQLYQLHQQQRQQERR